MTKRLAVAFPLIYVLVHLCLSMGHGDLRESQNSEHRGLIINGRNAEKGRYPYFVTLDHNGGGVLIAPDIVLTAGHCKPRKRDNLKPRVGTYSFSRDRKIVDYEQFDIVDMVRHPGWIQVNEDDFIWDFLLIKLDGKSNKPVIKINRQADVPYEGQYVVAMGVGNTNPYFESKADTLQEVPLEYLSNDMCSESFDPARNLTYQDHINISMMCTTGGPRNERDACSYDSGSPIIIPGKNSEQDLLVGLVSWGELCADPDFPGVNSRVSSVSEWIDSVVCELSIDPPSDFCPERTDARSWHLMLMVVGIIAVTMAFFALCDCRAKKSLGVGDLDKSDTLIEKELLCNTYASRSEGESYGSIEAIALTTD
jgi:secreted trypsin-like serine protease